MPITFIGPVCARPGCRRPPWKDRLCANCWRLARLFSKDVEMFAYQPLHGYRDDRDAVELPWELWERDADARGLGLAELFAEAPGGQRFEPRRRVRRRGNA
jgi:hypothetical protein